MAAACEDYERRERHRWYLSLCKEDYVVFHQVLGQPPGIAKGGRMSNDAIWVRGVTGIQLHHTTDLQDAGRFLGNATMALRAAHVRTGDDRYSDLATQLKAVLVLARELE